MSNFAIYLIGFVVLIGGLAYGANLLGVPQIWIGVGSVVLLGLALMTGVSRTRHREASPTDGSARRIVVEE